MHLQAANIDLICCDGLKAFVQLYLKPASLETGKMSTVSKSWAVNCPSEFMVVVQG